MEDLFKDIRPYIDSEVPATMERLIHNEEFLNAVVRFELARLPKEQQEQAVPQRKVELLENLSKIKTIADGQNLISKYVQILLENTTSSLVPVGLNDSSQETAHLFMSNHRDIVMDPSFISYLMHESVHGTVQIAIGDNLLKKEFVSDLMKLNKSFVVKRSVKGREKLFALKELSEYIHHCIKTKNNVWIAHREGRAKDSLDKTDPTILKMLHIANRDSAEEFTLKDSINQLHIIPVSISYEYDPCAILKAKELYEIDKNGSFEKDETTDLVSIITGINGIKGHVHLHFGEEIIAQTDDPSKIALQIDEKIILNYKMHPSNIIAFEKLKEIEEIDSDIFIDKSEVTEEKRKEFEQLLIDVEDEILPYFLKIYANPLINKHRLQKELAAQ